MPDLPWTIERTAKDAIVVRMVLDESTTTWEQWFLLRSDAHHDNVHSDNDLERRHLDEAVDRGAGILDAGDLFCAMQGKYDRRSDRSALRPEHQAGQYLDSLVRTASEFYAPYASRWVMCSPGNHEDSIKDRHETCLTSRLVQSMNDAGGNVQCMPYAGWVVFSIKEAPYDKARAYHHVLRYHHGSGGGGPVTKGVIRTNRDQDSCRADSYWSGHVHEAWHVERGVSGCSKLGTPYTTSCDHICTPGYKDEFSGGDGWSIRTGKGPKPLGGYWLRLRVSPRRGIDVKYIRTDQD